MKRFSIGEAIGSPFHLAGRYPVSMFVWGLLSLIPAVLGSLVSLDMMAAMIAQGAMEDPEAIPDMTQFMQHQSLSWGLSLIQLAVCAVIQTAVYRAVFVGGRDAVFFLRLGTAELRVMVISLAIVIGIYVVAIVVSLVAVALGFALAQLVRPWNVVTIVGVVFTAFVVFLWLLLRVSLIAPASVALNSFAFEEGWRLAKGQTWRLLALGFVLTVIFIMVYLVIIVAGIGILAATGGLDQLQNMNPETWLTSELNWQAYWPWLALASVPCALIYGFFLALISAPFASATRQIVGKTPPHKPEDSVTADAVPSH